MNTIDHHARIVSALEAKGAERTIELAAAKDEIRRLAHELLDVQALIAEHDESAKDAGREVASLREQLAAETACRVDTAARWERTCEQLAAVTKERDALMKANEDFAGAISTLPGLTRRDAIENARRSILELLALRERMEALAAGLERYAYDVPCSNVGPLHRDTARRIREALAASTQPPAVDMDAEFDRLSDDAIAWLKPPCGHYRLAHGHGWGWLACTDAAPTGGPDVARALLARCVKYAREDRMVTSGVTRLARALAEAERLLAQPPTPTDVSPWCPLHGIHSVECICDDEPLPGAEETEARHRQHATFGASGTSPAVRDESAAWWVEHTIGRLNNIIGRDRPPKYDEVLALRDELLAARNTPSIPPLPAGCERAPRGTFGLKTRDFEYGISRDGTLVHIYTADGFHCGMHRVDVLRALLAREDGAT